MTTRRNVLKGIAVSSLMAATPFSVARAAPNRVISDRSIAAAAAYARSKDTAPRRSPGCTFQFAAMRNGKTVLEHGDHEWARWDQARVNVSASLAGLMAAALVADGQLSLDAPLADILPEWRGDRAYAGITTRHLLTMTAGFAPGPSPRIPTYAKALKLRPVYAPGERYAHGPAPMQIFGAVVARVTGVRGVCIQDWVQARLLDPIDLPPRKYGQWFMDNDANLDLSRGRMFTVSELARIGTMVLDASRGRGPVKLDPAALAACFEGTQANPGYGMTWWLLRPGLVDPPPPLDRLKVDAAHIAQMADVRMAASETGQRLYLLPDHGLVIAHEGNFQRSPGFGPHEVLPPPPEKAFSERVFLEILLGG
jgi:CubicO group peptidase (beta-lactamase class C family)